MREFSEVKFFSLQKLSGKYGVTVGVTLLLFACSIVEGILVEQLAPPVNLASFILYEIIAFLVNILMGILVSGRTYLYMNIIYDRPAAFADLRQGFVQHPEKAVILQIPFALAASLMTIPLEVFQLFYWDTRDLQVMQNCLSFFVIGLVVYLAVQLLFAQVFFLLHDFPERRPLELFQASVRMMRGHKMTYALLFLSFLPLFLLSALLFFVPVLFVISQLYVVQAGFYRALTKKHEDHARGPAGAWSGEMR
ncbi:MAG: DUF975 family protein [Lachnospiraceae bacterium]|nr:DUF975 family protein [Lachnospiraceae bacterium]